MNTHRTDDMFARHLCGEQDRPAPTPAMLNSEMCRDLISNVEPVGRPQRTVHIRNQQRNGRKTLTTIQGLPNLQDTPDGYEIDVHKVLKYMRRFFSTNGAILKDDDKLNVIQLQGDFRKQACEFLTRHNICQRDQIQVHGF
jgi:translation initiation factor 1